jgi:hypothetical protein
MAYQESDFLKAIAVSFHKYEEYGPRSTQKLKPLHTYIASILKDIWGDRYEYHYLGDELRTVEYTAAHKQMVKTKQVKVREKTVEGKYYPKDIDLCITDEGRPIFCLGIKFVTSNYKQNANNYLENMMGETANIQALGHSPYFQLLILRRHTPYFKKNEKVPSKIEVIDERDFKKYVLLMYDTPQAHRPQGMGIGFIDVDDQTGAVRSAPYRDFFEPAFAEMLEARLSVAHLFEEVKHYKTAYELR